MPPSTATNHRKTVFVALSGGVDSSIATALLQERGFRVIGVHIKMWSDPSIPCRFKEDRYDALRVAEKLGIPFQTWDLTEEYKRAVVDYMIREYATGRTPNPDVMCNRYIKFGAFLRRALEQGADFVATGHYVRLCGGAPRHFVAADNKISRPAAPTCRVLQARDGNKDQSYFLWTITQAQLRHCLFPIGDYIKPEVRELARKFGLPTAEKKDSQGICFIGEIDIRQFLKNYIPTERGRILTTSGRTVGEHDGLPFYTIGQREGLGIGGGIPYYAVEKNPETNTLVVGEGPFDEKLFSSELIAAEVNWIAGHAPKLPFRCEARIRYRQPLQKCTLQPQTTNYKLQTVFNAPQRAVTPGQSIVFYRGEEMLGGGIITNTIP